MACIERFSFWWIGSTVQNLKTPNEIAAANAGLRDWFVEKSLVVLRPWPVWLGLIVTRCFRYVTITKQ